MAIQNPLSTEEFLQELQLESGHQGECRLSLPGTTKAKLVSPQPANHQRMDIAQEDPKVQLEAELRGPACTLQEQCPGARAWALHKMGAQPGRRIRRHQLDGIKLACAR
jgi:hypothetical protein